MTNELTIPYVAQLVLSLPDDVERATLTVTLAPADKLPVGGRSKRLADCTLAELHGAAATLQDEIWAAYDDITLLTLDEDKDIAVTITLMDEAGNLDVELADWQTHHVILLDKGVVASAGETAPQLADQPTSTGKPSGAVTSESAAQRPQESEESPVEEPQPVTPTLPGHALETASDLADVKAAIDIPPAQPEEDEDEGVVAAAVPAIAPSAARVRVAGHQLPIGSYTSAAVDILMDEPPLRTMQAHALSSLDREVAGVMVGPRPEKQPDGRYVVRIIDSIDAKYTVMQGASVTYTPDSWRYLNDTLMERYPDETAVMVGWYHTHPGFGIFLSGMDMFIHQNFFTQIWHIAYVLDPRARTSGFFCWSRDRTRVNRYDFGWPEWSAGSW